MSAWVRRVAALAAMTAAAALTAAAAPLAAQEPQAPSDNTAHANAPEPRAADEEEIPPVALTPAQEARARVLEGELRCPVCRSQSIRQSRSFMADDMRRRVRQMIAEGRSNEEIKQYFVDRYSAWVLLTPPKRGFNLAAYFFPAVVVIIGALGLAFASRRWKRVSTGAVEPPPPSRHLARLEREIEEIE